MADIHVVSAETTARLAKELDEQSIIKDGFAVMALFEVEQAIFYMAADTEEGQHLRKSTYASFEYLVEKIYGSENFAESYISDAKLFASLVRNQSMQ